jgi:hypothetical protein
LALTASICLTIPFLNGHALHAYFDTAGKAFLAISMILIWPSLWAAAMAYNFRAHHQKLRRIYYGEDG